ncbi:MAG: hypothetical protein A3J38_06590 [Gammaproteobacteria bacterium RIFCSPHIGHO2_12_FULL_45_9]|nr:MAG: hypothetical protein A3J38_06590 [Gammaproteobacteria bacterium RIFCSPHIGHO2_12_FULL_45_9]
MMYRQSWSASSDHMGSLSLQELLRQAQWISALTARLGPITLHLLCWESQALFEDEIMLLDRADASVRMVLFKAGEAIVSCGRVLIPPETYTAYQAQFAALQTQPLGRTLLYGKPDTTRSAFQYAALTAVHPWWQALTRYGVVPPVPFFVRRSVFHLAGRYPLVVCEGCLDMTLLEGSHEWGGVYAQQSL